MDSAWNSQFIDDLTVLGFIIGIMNYDENLSQSDKDDLMQRFDAQTKELLNHIDDKLSKQNILLADIQRRLERIEKTYTS